MWFFEVKEERKVVALNKVLEPQSLTRDGWVSLFKELGFKVENQMGLDDNGAFVDNYYHAQDSELQLEHIHKSGNHIIWAVKSKKKGRAKNKALVKKHSIILKAGMSNKEFSNTLENLLETIRAQYARPI
jgi:hypothetical protein